MIILTNDLIWQLRSQTLLDFGNLDFDQIFGFDDTSPIMMLIWIIPIVLFVFYGQRIQLQITSNDIKKNIGKLLKFKNESRQDLLDYLKKELRPTSDPTTKIDSFLDYFTIMPVDLDPNGIVSKIRHIVRSREDITREQIRSISSGISESELSKVQTLLEISSSLHLLYKVVNHLFLTAKKQNNYPLILPLQMILPFIMEEAEALKEAIPAFKNGQPVGDSIGPMVVGQMMLDTSKQKIAFQTVLSESEFEGRKLFLMKAEGPQATVGRIGDAVEELITKDKPDAIIMIDAALKLEGEDSATISHGFGAAIGGIGTERFQIEEVATRHKIPIFAIVIKQSVKDAITLMNKEISDKADELRENLYTMIRDVSKQSQSVLVIGVGNTVGVSQ